MGVMLKPGSVRNEAIDDDVVRSCQCLMVCRPSKAHGEERFGEYAGRVDQVPRWYS